MRFAYYERLPKDERAIYRRSDALVEVPLSRAPELRALIPDIEGALIADDRAGVGRATSTLVAAVLDDLGAPPVVVRVLAKRPRDDDGGELHGLYFAEDGEPPVLRVWMRTAARRQPVALKSFVRTVMHEVVHHLDFTIHDLAPSFHCEGFFKREAHLSRQLLRDSAAPLRAPVPLAPPTPKAMRPRAREAPQLELFAVPVVRARAP